MEIYTKQQKKTNCRDKIKFVLVLTKCCHFKHFTTGVRRCSFWILWMRPSSVTIKMKAIEQYLREVLFIVPYKVVLTFQSVDEIPKGDHSNESYWVVALHGTIAFKQNKFTTFFHSVCLASLEGKETTKLLTSCPVVIRSLNLTCFRRSLITWK